MASINDLATAATIASSAVALQSSPTQQASQPAQSSPPPPAPLSPSSSSAPAPQQQQQQPPAPTTPSASASTTLASSSISSSSSGPEATATTPSALPTTTTPGPSVLAAPQISPQNPAQAQIPAPATPTAAALTGAGAPGAGAGAAAGNGTTADESGAMDGVETTAAPDPKPVRGAFVVFEGMDRAGKTTQAKLLQQRCVESGREVRFMRFPDRSTPIGQMIDSYLKGDSEIEDHVIHLLFSANRWEAVKKIKAELEAGHTIICDRFYHSGIVYSAAKQLPSLSLSWAKAPEVGLPRPDMVLFLDLEESVARERGGWGGEVYEKGEMQRRVRDLFWGLSMGDLGSAVSKNNNSSGSGSNNSGGAGNNGNIKGSRFLSNGSGAAGGGEFRQEEEDIQIVDADLGVEELSEKVWEVVLPRLRAVERGEVGRTVRIVR
ncbi:thymidylate kinase-domain-containing protein [Biscogniauxia mediterranea]|nr:thymidylate kinase-domain-containing protein [Biscogniauxia mediterranea]